MKNLILILMCLFGSSVFAQSEYAVLSQLEKNTVQTDKVELVSPETAVSRGVIPKTDARHYKMVFANQNHALRLYALSPKAKITLLTFPNRTPKIATLEVLKWQLEYSEKLPSEFWGGTLFQITRSNNIITAITEVNTRAVTGVFEQAVYISKQSTFNPVKLMLDFVFAYTTNREMQRDGKTMEDNPGGLYISNNNPELRPFVLAKGSRIRLLIDVTAYVNVSASDLENGLNGNWKGFYFTWDTHFIATISDLTNEVLDLRQGHEP